MKGVVLLDDPPVVGEAVVAELVIALDTCKKKKSTNVSAKHSTD